MISILEALGYNVSGGKFVSARRSTLPHKQTSTSMPRSPTTSSCTKYSVYTSRDVKGGCVDTSPIGLRTDIVAPT